MRPSALLVLCALLNAVARDTDHLHDYLLTINAKKTKESNPPSHKIVRNIFYKDGLTTVRPCKILSSNRLSFPKSLRRPQTA